MSFTPGSAAWLLRHEAKLMLRGRMHGGLLITLGALVWLVMHAAAWPLLHWWRGGLSTSAMLALGTAVLIVASLMLAQAIALSVDALFVRGDLDLLLASPLAPRTVFLVRSLAIAFAAVVAYGFFITPFANMGPFTHHAGLLAIYPALIALALLTTALGMALTLALVRWLGARRARVVAQVLGAVLGAAVFLASQAPNMLGDHAGARVSMLFAQWTREADSPLVASVLWLPVRAITGDAASLLWLCAIALLAFWIMVQFAARYFLAGTQQSVTSRARVHRPPAKAAFRSGVTWNVLRKEWKLIARDPNLIAQTLLQVLYALPLLFIIARRDTSAGGLAPLLILIGTTLSGTLTWLTVAAEDAPELIGSAPVALVRLRWMKVAAAITPVVAIMVPVVAWAMRGAPVRGMLTIVCLVGGAMSAGAMQVWYPQTGKRTELKRRNRSSMLLSILELMTGLAWTGVAWTLGVAPAFALLALPLALLGPGLAWLLGRERRAEMRQ